MAYQLKEINARIQSGPEEFLHECDAGYAKKIRTTADRIVANLKDDPIVLLSGPSGSGKTTTALKIEEELKRRGINTHTVSLDNYFFTQNHATMPRTPAGDLDYESPEILDIELLGLHFDALGAGGEIIVPHFEFARQMRNDSLGTPLRLGKDEVAVFEGIHALNPEIAGRHPEAFRLYISARSNVLDDGVLRFKATWMRLARRAVRDYNFRGKGVETTFAMWNSVRRGEKAYISPYKNTAHVMLDSSLAYEVPVMRAYAAPLSSAIPPDSPRHDEQVRLVQAFDHFSPIDPAIVPKDSLLREFIGGGSYCYPH